MSALMADSASLDEIGFRAKLANFPVVMWTGMNWTRDS